MRWEYFLDSIRNIRMHSHCAVCGGADLEQMWEVNGYTIASCRTCSLKFVQNQVSTEELAAHYASGRDESYDDTNLECLNYYYRKLGDLIRDYYPQPGRLLDVGCSRGWFLDAMPG